MSNPINSITDPDKWESGINSNYELNGILFDITENIEINNKQFLVRGENGSIATGKLYVLNNDTNGITAETYLQGKSYTDELRSVSLTVDSATDLNGTLDVQNATTLRSTLNVLGDANLDGTLDVSGTANLQNAVTMNSTLDVNGDTNINGQTVISSNTDSTLVVKATSNISQDTMLDIIGARNSNNTAYQSQLRLMNYDNDITTTNILGAVVGKVNNTATNIGDMILQTSSDGTTMSDTMTLTSSGNVGIGTDNPNHKLSICDGAISRNTSGHSNDVLEINVQSDEAFILLESRQTLKDSGIRLYTQGVDSAMYYNESDDHFAISIGNVDGETNRHNNEKFVIDSTGNVGIGTTDPAQKLTVYKNTRFNPTSNVSYDGDYTLNIQSSNNNYNNGNYGGSIVFSQRWWTGDSALVPTGFITTKKETNSGNFGGGLILGSVSGTTHNEVIHIKTNGNVGIGTDNPTEKLDVNGNAKISGDLAVNTNTLFVDSVNNRVGINTITPEYGLDVNTLSRFTQNIEFTGNNRGILGSSGSNLLVYSQGNGTGEGLFLFNSTDDGTDKDAEIQLLRENVITFSTNNDERMRIAADGDVGIGTLNPAGKLDVGGNIIISGTITNEPENLTIRYYDNNNYINPGANSTLGSINFDANWGGTYQTHNQIKSITSSSQSNGRVRTSLAFLVSNTTSNSVANLYEAMRIEDDGNVGIGTAAPTQKLDVNGNAEIGPTDNESMVIGNMSYSGWSGIANKNFASAGNYALLQSGSSGRLLINRPSGEQMEFRENNSTQMIIKSGGNVGIGTVNPSTTLDVNGIISTGTSDGDKIYLTGSYDNGSKISHSSGWSLNLEAGPSSGSNGIIKFTTSGRTERMRIAANGNVGIGNTNPSNKLHIAETNGGSVTYPLLVANSSSTNGTGAGIQFKAAGSAITGEIINKRYGNSDYGTTFEVFDGGLGLVEHMVLRNSRVGIGTNNPSSKLEVNGTFNVTGNNGFSGSVVAFAGERNSSTGSTNLYSYGNGNNTLGTGILQPASGRVIAISYKANSNASNLYVQVLKNNSGSSAAQLYVNNNNSAYTTSTTLTFNAGDYLAAAVTSGVANNDSICTFWVKYD